MKTIWEYLESIGFDVVPRPEKKVVHLALESDKMNGAQKKRQAHRYEVLEKLDGVFSLVTIVPLLGGEIEVRHWGRSGKALSNCEVLDAKISHGMTLGAMGRRKLAPMILISEITSDNPLAELSGFLTPSRVNPVTIEQRNLKDNFHDILSVQEFIKGESDMTYFYRQANLSSFLHGTGFTPIKSEGFMTLHDAQFLAKEKFFPEGKEGLICKAPHAKWIAGKRDETVIKIKEKLSFDVTVVGMTSGKQGSKYEDTLGKLIVVFSKHAKTDMSDLVEIPISGMTDEQRFKWWWTPAEIIGKTVKMDAKSFTATGNLREPRFKEVREDKGSDFPVGIMGNIPEKFEKGKALWVLWNWKTL